ncbi:MAG: hypothetical protein LBD23_09975 [Oscillospiraceae bacterium]|jgi:hypothetical protein|nr:hypothetical protein [Oscillospiraceae bacterium]
MNLSVDCAYFITTSRFPVKKFAKTVRFINKILSLEVVDISMQHQFTNDLCVAALLPERVPSSKLIKRIIDRSNKKQIKYKQTIIMGETTTLGGGGVSTFDGVHCDYFWKNREAEVLRDKGSYTPVEIYCGDIFMDRLFNIILQNISKDNDSDDNMDKILRSLIITMEETRKTLEMREEGKDSVIISSVLKKSIEELLDIYQTITNDDISTYFLQWLEKRNILETEYEQKTDKNRKNLPPSGKRISVSERLEIYRKNNIDQLEQTKSNTTLLVGLAIPALAIICIGYLDNISKFKYLCYSNIFLLVAIALTFFACLLSLISIIKYNSSENKINKNYEKRENKYKIKYNRNKKYNLQKLNDYRIQRLFPINGQKYVWKLNERARYNERINLTANLNQTRSEGGEAIEHTPIDILCANMIISTARNLFMQRRIMSVSMGIFTIALVVYIMAIIAFIWWS